MPFPLMMEQEGIIVGIISAPGWKGEGIIPPICPAPDPNITIKLLRKLADLIEKNK